MIRVLAGLVEDSIAGDHVVNYVALGDLLGPEGLRSGEVHPIVVAEMVVADDRRRLPR